MKTEVLPERPVISALKVDNDTGLQHTTLMDRLRSRSQLVWGEHCTECAYPSCYSTCTLYSPRLDGNCRRFETGFEPLAANSEFKRVRFKQWGKVEARGPARAFSAQLTEAGALDPIWDQLAHAPLAPTRVKRKVAHLRQRSVVDQSMAQRTGDFDAFVLEAIAADDREHTLTLTIKNEADTSGALFQAHAVVGPRYGRHVIPISKIAAYVDLDASHLIQIEPMGDAAGRDIIFALCDFVKWRREPLPSVAGNSLSPLATDRPAKVLVWDLDNTIWRGTLAEDGIEGLKLIPEAARAVSALDERGVIQSVASKNDHDMAFEALRHFGLLDYFIAPQISWRPKSEAVGDIAATLNLGLDSFVFIDDQAFERAEVVHAHPQVRTVEHHQVSGLLQLKCFDLPVTEESRSRRSMYLQDQSRSAALESSGIGYREFLRASEIVLTLDALSDETATRVHELTQRTNQLNFMGAKFSELDVRRMLQNGAAKTTITMQCKDRYGHYGLIGAAVVDFSNGAIEQFFMSCRVQKKRVEHAFFAWLKAELIAAGQATLRISHRATERNGAARAMLDDLGFSQVSAEVWSRDLAEPFSDGDLVRLDDRLVRDGRDAPRAVSGDAR